MAGMDAVSRLLERNKELISRELESTKILGILVKKGVLSPDEEQAVCCQSDANVRCEVFVKVLAQKGLTAFRELCYALEKECPHVLTSLLVDTGGNNATVKTAVTASQQQQQPAESAEQQAAAAKDAGTEGGSGSSSSLSLSSAAAPATEDDDDEDPPPASNEMSLQTPVGAPPPGLHVLPVTQEAQVRRGLQQQPVSSPPPATPPIAFSSEMLEEPVVEEQSGERISWEYHTVTLSRVPGYGFGIAVSGGRDNPHFVNGDPAIAISDVLKAGPAEGRLQVNDRILSANSVSLENVDYATAVQVLRDSGHTVQLVVKRRVVLPGPSTSSLAPSTLLAAAGPQQPQPPEQPQTLRVSLARGKKKDDFGLVLGCRLYIREAGARCREAGLREGDALLSINALPTDNMTLKEAKKLMDQSKERLNLVVRRDPPQGGSSTLGGATSLTRLQPEALHKQQSSHSNSNLLEPRGTAGYSAQNLYVQPPTRGSYPDPDKSSNLAPRTTPGRSRGPLMDVSLSQLDRPATPATDLDGPPPRPALPRPEDYYSSRRQLYDDDPLVQRNKLPMPDPRFITFQKEGSVGIRLTGGNEAGIFVTAVQPGSPASLQGLQPGDKILKVNDVDVKGMTREEAVLLLLSLQDQIDLIVQFRRDEYDQVVASQRGDSFHIKTHFNYDQPSKGEMSFRKGDVFHVVDTLYNGVVGSWQVYRIGRNNQEVQKGIVPNKARADELAAAQLSASKKELTASESRGSFFRRRRGSHRRSKSLSKDHWDDVVFADSMNKFPAYERVVLRHPGFVRPVVLFGPVADVAREKLLRDFPDKFTSPQIEGNTEGEKGAKSGIIRLSAIREMVERGKHGLLDITPNAVDRLNYAQFYPMVVFLRAENKQVVKELRAGTAKGLHKSSKKLLEQSQKLEKLWSHVFTGTVTLTSGSDAWYRKLREMLEAQQSQPVWISETKPEEALSDDFLFPMTSRLSYASSPESDLDLSPEPRPQGGNSSSAVPSAGHVLHQHLLMSGAGNSNSRLVRSTSDPSIATQEELGVIPSYSGPPPYMPPYKQSHEGHSSSSQRHHGQQQQQQQTPSTNGVDAGHSKRRSQQPGDGSKYGFSSSQQPEEQQNGHHHHFHPPPSAHTHHPPSSHHHHPHPPAYRGAEPRSPLTHSPPPPHRGQQAEQADFPPPPHRQGDPPELPPRVDRTNKPPGVRGHAGTPRSAQQDRLFGETGDANYMNAGTHAQHLRGSSSLERTQQHPSALKTQSSYDSVSSYDSFNRLGPNAHDDLKSSNNGGSPQPPTSPRNHDPYRFTRSTAQPIKANDRSPVSKAPEFPPNKYRSDYKPSPPPKGAPGMPSSPHQQPPTSYKPVPPPKPKNYRPPNQQPGSDLYWAREEQHISYQAQQQQSGYYHARSYSVGESMAGQQQAQVQQNGGVPQMNGGRGDGEDSGHGSSLDRNYSTSSYQYHHASPSAHHGHHASPSKSSRGGGGSNASQYYYNVPGGQRLTNGHHREASSGLDLANREQRGSAFELYRKPADPRTPPAYIEHGMRHVLHDDEDSLEVVAAARGVFGQQGGTLADAGVSLVIPEGAIAPGQRHEIFFKVCRSDDPNLLPPLDQGEELLSPLVLCGPHGLRFLVPVELRLPAAPPLVHSAPSPEERWSLTLRAGDVAEKLRWLEPASFCAVPRRVGTHISVFVDHF